MNMKYFCHIISKDPIIITTVTVIRQKVLPIMEFIKNRKAYFLIWPYYTFEDKNFFQSEKIEYEAFKRNYPNCEIIFLLNTAKEADVVRSNGISGTFCSQNAMIDENIFNIRSEQKIYDAVYNAKMAGWKNHLLAGMIKKLALLTYFNDNTEGQKIYEYLKERLHDAVWLNFQNGIYKLFTSDEIAKSLNQSRVGLCLSSAEGANYASCEYLLCGLPVVSLKSKGGRDIFFEKSYTKIVENDAGSVKKGVYDLIEQNISPYFIRSRVLEKFNYHRNQFMNLVQTIYDNEGKKRRFKDEWQDVFIDKMLNLYDRTEMESMLS